MVARSLLNKENAWELGFSLCMSAAVVLLGKPNAVAYTIAFFFFVVVACLIDCCKSSRILYSGLLVLMVGSIAAFTGFRDFGVGWDTNLYINYYFTEAQNIHGITDFLQGFGDKGFLALAKLSTLFSTDAQSLLFFESLFVILFFCLGIREFNKPFVRVRWSTIIFFWSFTFLNISLNLMRQYCAMSLLFWSFSLLLNDKWKKSLVVFVVAYFFHSSAFLCSLLFLYYYLSGIESKKIRMSVTMVSLLVSLFAVIFLFKTLPFLANFGFVSDVYVDRYGANNSFKSENVFGLGIIAYIVVVYYAIYLMKKKKAINEKMAYIAFVVHSLFFILRLSTFSVNYLVRMSSYYYYFEILLVCALLNVRQTPRWIRFLLYFLTVFLWYRSYIASPSGATYPYHSSILGI